MFIKTGCCVLSISSPSSGWGMETKTDQSNDSLNSRALVHYQCVRVCGHSWIPKALPHYCVIITFVKNESVEVVISAVSESLFVEELKA